MSQVCKPMASVRWVYELCIGGVVLGQCPSGCRVLCCGASLAVFNQVAGFFAAGAGGMQHATQPTGAGISSSRLKAGGFIELMLTPFDLDAQLPIFL